MAAPFNEEDNVTP